MIDQLGRGHHLGRPVIGRSERYFIKPAGSEHRSKLETEYRRGRKLKSKTRTISRKSDSDGYRLRWPRIFNIFTKQEMKSVEFVI